MQSCGKCDKKFDWNQIIKSIWLGYKPIECSNCHTIYSITLLSRALWSVVTLLPAFFLLFYLINSNWAINTKTILLVIPSILWVLVSQVFLPYLVKYKRLI